MKDAKGHGSNPRGIASVRYKVKDPTWTGTVITHGPKPVVSGGQPKSSNAEAAGALASGPKSEPAPAHDAMQQSSSQTEKPDTLTYSRGIGAGTVHYRTDGKSATKATPVESRNAPFKSRLGRRAGHSYLDPHDPRAKRR